MTKSVIQSGTGKGAITDLLPGPCPYDCHDTLCKGYLNGYCGPSDSIIIKTNSSNAYDYVGATHNSGCDYVLSHISLTSSTVYSDLLYQDKIYVKSKAYDSADVSKAYLGGRQTGYLYNPDSIYTNNPTLLINKLYTDNRISLTAKNYYNTLISYVNNVIGSNSPSSTVYNTFANDMINLESQINSSSSLSSNDRQALLSACSVARYSAGYWGEYVLSGNGVNSSGGTSTNSFTLFGIHINWKKTLSADVVGAIGGFFGSLFSGGGVIAGTIGGAIGGSIGEIVIENTNLA